ncbi:hypothetical protein [Streptomyces europaeiscabiei]|uniref:hypothetical protein n=1 Tax=Streptomyces europaeiscabiei TaxID=146819 RepID=UPI0029B7E2DB|nr:hypothetical protein [Streptomyces europaeiscabiei]MDX3612856.1 hypothetical protein [Streptomyces europaeiscabiei]
MSSGPRENGVSSMVPPTAPAGPDLVAADNALGHILRRLQHEAADPDVTHFAEFESSIDFEAPMR